MIKVTSLRARYLWAGMTICLLSLVLVSGFSYVVSYRITAELLDNRVAELALAKAQEFDAWFATKEMIVEGLAQDIQATGDYGNEHLARLIKSKMKLYADQLQDFYVGFAEGRKPLSGVGWTAPDDYDARTRPWFKAAAASDKTIFTDPYLDAMTGKQIITVAHALRIAGRLVGVLATDISIVELISMVNSLRIGENSYALLLDREGRIIAHPESSFLPTKDGVRAVADIAWPDFGRLVDILRTQGPVNKISLSGHQGGQEYFLFRQMRKTGWFFGVAISHSEYKRPLTLLLVGFGAAFALSMLVGVLVMQRLVQGMLRPVRALTGVVASFSSSNLAVRAEVASGDELGQLGSSFNAMADTIAEYSHGLERKVEERTRELQDKNDQIMDSIRYARRLQKAILPELAGLPGLGPEQCFAIWRPRDTVGGDMYWGRGEGPATLLVLADCTGHGVPGALMAMTLNSILDATVRETGLDSPARIMHLAHTRLRQALRQNLRQDQAGQDIDDGAEAAMLLLTPAAGRLVFCGAGLSLFAALGAQVEEFPGESHGLGYTRGKEVRFQDTVIPWRPGLRLYLTSDGLLDQNREPLRCGMGRQGFRQWLESMAGLGLGEQQERMEAEIDARLRLVPQRDDICVIGVEL